MTLIDLPGGIDLADLCSLATSSSRARQKTAATVTDDLVPVIAYLRVSTKDQATRNG